MNVIVQYFASLRETLGTDREFVEAADGSTVATLRQQLIERGGEWQALARSTVRAAVNQSLSPESTPLEEGDEIAFFPPVTGG